MLVKIPETGIIKKQEFTIKKDVSIIYGYNNCGKTTILKALDQAFQNEVMQQFIFGTVRDLAIYIPTNRIVVSENNTDELRLNDYEDFIHYQKDSYKDYSLHLKRLRDQLLKNKMVHNFICHAIYEIFSIDIKEICSRYSDGIENIINIYLNAIWAMTWDLDIADFTEEGLREFLAEQQIYIMIDEIEMFLHVNIQSKLISSMKKDFAGCRFILTTHSPLLLTRYKNCMIYNIKDGRLQETEGDMYYEDLDIIYEQLFKVNELPIQVRDDINYLGEVILKSTEIDSKRIAGIVETLRKEYPNLCRRYNVMITKAQNIGDMND